MPVVKRTLNFYWSHLTNRTLCTYHYLNKLTTTIISTSNIFIMVGYNCFIVFQYHYLNIKILKFYENWNFLNFLKIWSFWNFLKILKSYEHFEFFWNFWNFEFLGNFELQCSNDRTTYNIQFFLCANSYSSRMHKAWYLYRNRTSHLRILFIID
jgi:hypothetical protein